MKSPWFALDLHFNLQVTLIIGAGFFDHVNSDLFLTDNDTSRKKFYVQTYMCAKSSESKLVIFIFFLELHITYTVQLDLYVIFEKFRYFSWSL